MIPLLYRLSYTALRQAVYIAFSGGFVKANGHAARFSAARAVPAIQPPPSRRSPA